MQISLLLSLGHRRHLPNGYQSVQDSSMNCVRRFSCGSGDCFRSEQLSAIFKAGKALSKGRISVDSEGAGEIGLYCRGKIGIAVFTREELHPAVDKSLRSVISVVGLFHFSRIASCWHL